MPSIKLSNIVLAKSGKVEKSLDKEVISSLELLIQKCVKEANEKNKGYMNPFWLVEYSKTTKETTCCSSFKDLFSEVENKQFFIIYLDPSKGYPTAILKNFIGAIGVFLEDAKKDKIPLSFISIRDKIPKECQKVEIKDSLYFELTIDKIQKLDWETWIMKDKDSENEWSIDLKQVMDRHMYSLID